VTLRPAVRAQLERHGVSIGHADTPEVLRERLNELYLVEVRRLRDRQVRGEIPRPEYARHVEALRDRFPLLGLPLPLWSE